MGNPTLAEAAWDFMMMFFWSILAFAVAVLAQTQWPISSTNYTDAVQWDHYSLIVKGERLVVWSGEFVCALFRCYCIRIRYSQQLTFRVALLVGVTL